MKKKIEYKWHSLDHGPQSLVGWVSDDDIEVTIEETRETIRKAELADKYRKALESISTLDGGTNTEEEINDAIESFFWAKFIATEALMGGDSD